MRFGQLALLGMFCFLALYVDAAERSDSDFRRELQTRLIRAQPGEVIQLPAGKWSFTRPLSIARSDITLRGAGADATVLSFEHQLQGGEGLTINGAARVTIENLAIEDAKGDALKANGCTDLTIRDVRIEWTRGPSEDNGGYGLYPVQCERVLIERSTVIGASDAGIYVGQSQDVVVRDNRVEFNVVGIEIENTTRADVYRNAVTNNTGGVLVIKMPHLPVKFGRQTRVFENRIHANNTANFAPPGNVIARVPAGTGFMVLASDEVEFFDNDVVDNRTAGALVVSFAATGKPANDRGYDPYPQQVFIHDNRFRGNGADPDVDNMQDLNLRRISSSPLPQIMWDGVVRKGESVESVHLCLDKNEGADFASIAIRKDAEAITRDTSPHSCTLPSLSAVAWPELTAGATSAE